MAAEISTENVNINAISPKQKGQIFVPILLAGGLIFMCNNKFRSNRVREDPKDRKRNRKDRYESKTEYFLLGFAYFIVFALLIQLYIKIKLSSVLMGSLICALIATVGTYWYDNRIENFTDEDDEEDEDEDEADEEDADEEDAEEDALEDEASDADTFQNVKIETDLDEEAELRARLRNNRDKSKNRTMKSSRSKSKSKQSNKYPKSILKKKNSKSRKVASVRLLDDSDVSDMSNNSKQAKLVHQMLVSNHRENKNYTGMNEHTDNYESYEPSGLGNMGSYELL
jgi:hypothetical protein